MRVGEGREKNENAVAIHMELKKKRTDWFHDYAVLRVCIVYIHIYPIYIYRILYIYNSVSLILFCLLACVCPCGVCMLF